MASAVVARDASLSRIGGDAASAPPAARGSASVAPSFRSGGVAALSAAAPIDIVINRGAADGDDGALTHHLVHALARTRREVRWYPIEHPDRLPGLAAHAARNAARDGGLLVAVGGDGTISTVARHALAADVPLALVPRGTFNYFAREHGVPTAAADAVALLTHGVVRRVQVGRVGEQPFLVSASLGLYPEVLEERERDARRFGRSPLVALASGLRTALRRTRRLDLRVDRDGAASHLTASTLFVGNNALQLETLGLLDVGAGDPREEREPRAPVGRLHAMALPPLPATGMLKVLARAAIGRLGGASELLHFALQRMQVRPLGARGQRLKLALDGEVRRVVGPLDFRVDPAALRLVVPSHA